jgi:hypothetical protein
MRQPCHMSALRHKKRTVKIMRPEQKEARDEGPRLLPLEDAKPSDSRLQHYIKLADVALKHRLGKPH